MGLGAVITAPDGTRHTVSKATHTVGCNNEAEFRAVMAAVQEARTQGARALLIHSDSTIVVEQLGQANAKAIARLSHVIDEARALLQSFDQVQLKWIPQHRNSDADALARKALDLQPRSHVPRTPADGVRPLVRIG